MTGVLAALVGMHGDGSFRPPLPHRNQQRIEHQFLLDPRTSVAVLGPEPGRLHQTANTVLAATLADIAKVAVDLAVTVNAATFQPKLLDEPGQSLVLNVPS